MSENENARQGEQQNKAAESGSCRFHVLLLGEFFRAGSLLTAVYMPVQKLTVTDVIRTAVDIRSWYLSAAGGSVACASPLPLSDATPLPLSADFALPLPCKQQADMILQDFHA